MSCWKRGQSSFFTQQGSTTVVQKFVTAKIVKCKKWMASLEILPRTFERFVLMVKSYCCLVYSYPSLFARLWQILTTILPWQITFFPDQQSYALWYFIFTVGCYDKNIWCTFWKLRGECEKNHKHMKVNCRKACKVCSSWWCRAFLRYGKVFNLSRRFKMARLYLAHLLSACKRLLCFNEWIPRPWSFARLC